MKDSSVIVFDGPRGSGKTLSAAWECAMRMVWDNENIISNVPISFELLEENGALKHYESKPLSIDNVITMAENLRDATIFWDEMGLDAYSRTSSAVKNRLISLVFTLIRKRGLRFVITTQATRFIDSNIRFQMDAIVNCFDMSYKWHYQNTPDGGKRRLRRGEYISQTWKDISGIFTGTQYEMDGRSYPRLFHSSIAWGIYDTNLEFDVLESQSKYKINMGTKLITKGDMESSVVSAPSYSQVASLLNDIPPNRYRSSEIVDYLKSSGVEVWPNRLGVDLKKAGWKRRRDDEGYFYEKVGI
jgi:hypothetical protein